jgi:hypothetical protein
MDVSPFIIACSLVTAVAAVPPGTGLGPSSTLGQRTIAAQRAGTAFSREFVLIGKDLIRYVAPGRVVCALQSADVTAHRRGAICDLRHTGIRRRTRRPTSPRRRTLEADVAKKERIGRSVGGTQNHMRRAAARRLCMRASGGSALLARGTFRCHATRNHAQQDNRQDGLEHMHVPFAPFARAQIATLRIAVLTVSVMRTADGRDYR